MFQKVAEMARRAAMLRPSGDYSEQSSHDSNASEFEPDSQEEERNGSDVYPGKVTRERSKAESIGDSEKVVVFGCKVMSLRCRGRVTMMRE
jgi:hypothetical protein